MTTVPNKEVLIGSNKSSTAPVAHCGRISLHAPRIPRLRGFGETGEIPRLRAIQKRKQPRQGSFRGSDCRRRIAPRGAELRGSREEPLLVFKAL